MRPKQLASRGIEAVKNACPASRVNAPTEESRCCARTITAQGLAEPNVIGVRPQHMAGVQFVADDQFILAPLFLRECAVAADGKGGPTQTDGLTPQLLRRMGGPIAV